MGTYFNVVAQRITGQEGPKELRAFIRKLTMHFEMDHPKVPSATCSNGLAPGTISRLQLQYDVERQNAIFGFALDDGSQAEARAEAAAEVRFEQALKAAEDRHARQMIAFEQRIEKAIFSVAKNFEAKATSYGLKAREIEKERLAAKEKKSNSLYMAIVFLLLSVVLGVLSALFPFKSGSMNAAYFGVAGLAFNRASLLCEAYKVASAEENAALKFVEGADTSMKNVYQDGATEVRKMISTDADRK